MIQRFRIYGEPDLRFEISDDPDAEDPRAWGNVGNMICFHGKYQLGDKHKLVSGDYAGWDALKKELQKRAGKGGVVVPLYLFDHSGLCMQTKPFGDKWDSGQVGFIYITIGDMRKNKWCKKDAEKAIETEVKVYNYWLMGESYGYRKYRLKPCKTCGHVEADLIDSCSGFYGPDMKENGLLEHAGYKESELVEIPEGEE